MLDNGIRVLNTLAELEICDAYQSEIRYLFGQYGRGLRERLGLKFEPKSDPAKATRVAEQMLDRYLEQGASSRATAMETYKHVLNLLEVILKCLNDESSANALKRNERRFHKANGMSC